MSLVRCFVVLCVGALALSAPATTATAAVPTSGHVLPAQATPPRQFLTFGDYVHLSSSPPRAVSAHGWWVRIDNEAPLALVSVQLQIKRAGLWLDVGSAGSKVIKSGGGSANRVRARAPCVGSDVHEWRSVVDVDLVGYLDSADRHFTPTRLLPCAT